MYIHVCCLSILKHFPWGKQIFGHNGFYSNTYTSKQYSCGFFLIVHTFKIMKIANQKTMSKVYRWSKTMFRISRFWTKEIHRRKASRPTISQRNCFFLKSTFIWWYIWWHTSAPYMQDKLCQHAT